jgi:hypothetical protein
MPSDNQTNSQSQEQQSAQTNKIDNSAIFASRDELNKKLVEALQMYGNLEPPGFIGRTYNASSKSHYQFSAANYLRMAVASRETGYRDNRWISEAYVKKWDIELKPEAKPVELEYWQNVDGGFKGELRKFYNVSDVTNREIEPKEIKPDQPDDLDYAVDLLKIGGSGIQRKGADALTVFNATKGLAKLHGADEFAATLAGQLMLKQSHLTLDYTKHRMFDETQLNRLEKNPKILFAAMRKAQKELYKMEYAQEQALKQHMEQVKAEHRLHEHTQEQGAKALHEPFKDLTVVFHWSEHNIKDFAGKPYLDEERQPGGEPLVLTGEKAYEFLVQLNAADKEAFDHKLQGGGYDKTKLEISYGDYQHGEMRVDLGDLELKNKANLADALQARLNAYREQLLTNAQEQYAYLNYHPEETAESLAAGCKADIAKCNAALEAFRQEESRYLATHREINAINESQANTFKYICPTEELDKLDKGVVLSAEPMEKYPGAMSKEMKPLVEGMGVVIESAIPPDSEYMRPHRAAGLQPIFTQEEAKTITDMEQKLRAELKVYPSITAPQQEIEEHNYTGVMALKAFTLEKELDAAISNAAAEDKRVDRDKCHQVELTLSYDGRKSPTLTYERGSGEFTRLPAVKAAMESPNKLPLHGYDGAEKDAAQVMAAVTALSKPIGLYHESQLKSTLYNRDEPRQPDLSECRATVQEEKPPAKAVNTRLYKYYETLAAQDMTKKTPEDIQRSMVKEMQQDGLKPLKMTNIAKTNADFKTELLPQLSKSKSQGKVTELTKDKTAKEKIQEKMAKQIKAKALAV